MKKQITLLLLFIVTVIQQTKAQCTAPTNLNVTVLNNVTTFTWDAVPNAVEYTLELKYPAYTWQNPEYIDVTQTNSLVLVGIMQSITLDWRVKANCGNNTFSPYSESQFNIPCPEPSAPFASSVTPTSATLNWTIAPGYNMIVSDFVLAYRIANNNGPWISLGHTFNNTQNLTGLQPNTTYEWCVNQTCPYGNSSPLISQFTTSSPPCVAATGLNETSIGSKQATLNWNAVYGATSYSVRYKLSTSNNWSSAINTVNLSRTITGLKANKTYNWKVTTTCGGNNYVSTIETFVTGYNANRPTYDNNTLEEIVENSNTIYPNPSEGLFNIVFAENDTPISYEVYNINGALIQKSIITTSKITINLNDKPSGLYVLKIMNVNGNQQLHKLHKL